MSAILHINTSKLFDNLDNLLFISIIDFAILFPFAFLMKKYCTILFFLLKICHFAIFYDIIFSYDI